MLRTALFALLLGVIGVCVADDPLPRLRHLCYLVLVADEAATVRADLNCIPHGTYPDWLEYTLYDRSGDEVAWGQIPPGAQAVLGAPMNTQGLHCTAYNISGNGNHGDCLFRYRLPRKGIHAKNSSGSKQCRGCFLC